MPSKIRTILAKAIQTIPDALILTSAGGKVRFNSMGKVF